MIIELLTTTIAALMISISIHHIICAVIEQFNIRYRSAFFLYAAYFSSAFFLNMQYLQYIVSSMSDMNIPFNFDQVFGSMTQEEGAGFTVFLTEKINVFFALIFLVLLFLYHISQHSNHWQSVAPLLLTPIMSSKGYKGMIEGLPKWLRSQAIIGLMNSGAAIVSIILPYLLIGYEMHESFMPIALLPLLILTNSFIPGGDGLSFAIFIMTNMLYGVNVGALSGIIYSIAFVYISGVLGYRLVSSMTSTPMLFFSFTQFTFAVLFGPLATILTPLIALYANASFSNDVNQD